ncbi:MAG: DUF5758 domain-containing protein [Christensenellales bacterium]
MDRFTEDRWVESTYGIHFWMSRENTSLLIKRFSAYSAYEKGGVFFIF